MAKTYAPDDEEAAYAIALARLTAQMRTRAQLQRSLTRKGFNETVVQNVLDKLEASGLVDDAQYAARMVEVSREKSGRRRIGQKLWARGIGDETAKEALCAISDDDECQYAAALAKGWLSAMADSPLQRKQKVYQRLVRRGFSFETAREALRTLDLELEEDDE